MPLTVADLGRLGATPHERGGYVMETPKFRAIFLLDSAPDAAGRWHMRVEPVPKRDGAVTLAVDSIDEVLRGLYYAGRVVGQEDIRGKFRALMDLAASDNTDDGGTVGGEEAAEPK